jgi:hypothetical protein
VKTSFTGVKWFVEGDIKGALIMLPSWLVQILRRRIDDEHFIGIDNADRACYAWTILNPESIQRRSTGIVQLLSACPQCHGAEHISLCDEIQYVQNLCRQVSDNHAENLRKI